jgi:putative acetyltransferase
MMIRPYESSDAPALADLYQDAVWEIGAQVYDAAQVEVWAAAVQDLAWFQQSLAQGLTLVAIAEAQIAAFGQLHPLDHVAFLYTASRFARQGYATEIYRRLEAHAQQQGIQQIHTEASRISQCFFLKMGYEVVETEWVERRGIWLERFKMQKQLNDAMSVAKIEM